jgi:predicted GIY-YIG superfamily endonuclease
MGPGFRRDDEAGEYMFDVYLLASKPHGTLYAGVTSDLAKRVWEHKN